MKKTTLCLLLVSVLAVGGQAVAEICTIDDVPAATLLLPYFEVDLSSANGITTLFSINNASATAAVAHVTLWTDESIPTLDFDVYLTGYDVQTLNVRDIFNGILPRTADDGIDDDGPGFGQPPSPISNHGAAPVNATLGDLDFAGGTGPCGTATTLYAAAPTSTLSPLFITHLRNAHTGFSSSIYGGCVGLRYADDLDHIARGYITVDNVNQCNLEFPNATSYFAQGGVGLANNNNTLWGDYFYVEPGENFAQGETLVHIEACSVIAGSVPLTATPNPGFSTCPTTTNPTGICQTGPSVGQNTDDCPFFAGEYTFYGRYVGAVGTDQREPLASNFATRYINGGPFDAGTDLIVWRDNKRALSAPVPVHACPGQFGGLTGWVPLNQADVVAFDEHENPTNLCFVGANVSPPLGGAGAQTCFPVEAQRVNLLSSDVPGGATPGPPAPFGWIFLNLNTSVNGQIPGLPTAVAQAWVTTIMSAEDRYSVGFDAIRLDTVCDNLTGGVVLLQP